jgi:hypothetical protein
MRCSGRFPQRSERAGTCSEHLKAVTDDLGRRRLSSARNHGFMFGVGIVDKARAAMSEAGE